MERVGSCTTKSQILSLMNKTENESRRFTEQLNCPLIHATHVQPCGNDPHNSMWDFFDLSRYSKFLKSPFACSFGKTFLT